VSFERRTRRMRVRSITEGDRAEFLRIRALGEAAHAPFSAERVGTFEEMFAIVRGVAEYANTGWSANLEVEGRGYTSEGVAALVDVALSPPPRGLGLHRVQAGIMPRNAASLGVARRVGFRREGLALRYIRIAGEWEDHELWAITAEEWPGLPLSGERGA
jgi:ribosomal-protein-alanine N-acetyltransferase